MFIPWQFGAYPTAPASLSASTHAMPNTFSKHNITYNLSGNVQISSAYLAPCVVVFEGDTV